MVVQNHLSLQFYGIGCPLLASMGTGHMCDALKDIKQNIHTHKSNNLNRKTNNKNLSLQYNSTQGGL